MESPFLWTIIFAKLLSQGRRSTLVFNLGRDRILVTSPIPFASNSRLCSGRRTGPQWKGGFSLFCYDTISLLCKMNFFFLGELNFFHCFCHLTWLTCKPYIRISFPVWRHHIFLIWSFKIFKSNHNVETAAARKCGIIIQISEGEDREVRGITWAHTDPGA